MVTKDVAPNTTMVGIPAKAVLVDIVHYSPGFVPYGTTCGEDIDPVRVRLCELEEEIAVLRREVQQMRAIRQDAPEARAS